MYVSRVATEWATALKEGNFPLAPTPSGSSENVSTAIQERGFFLCLVKKKENTSETDLCVDLQILYLPCL